MEYKEGELAELHTHLYDILSRTIEVCDKLGISYFIIAGTAIGAYYEESILEWDDDIDIGMERDQYERFLAEAPAHIADGYVMQHPTCEPNTPYYFAKVRKSGTRFEGEDELDLDIHHGIYIDIFPLDRVPDNPTQELIHRWLVRNLANIFVATTIPLREGGALRKWVINSVAKIFRKSTIYKMLTWAQTLYTNSDTEYINIVKMPRDHIARVNIEPLTKIVLGGMMVDAPRNIEQYLRWHYPNLRRTLPVEERVNHAPMYLNFNGEERC